MSQPHVFSQTAALSHAPSHPVAVQNGVVRDWAHWLGNVAALRERLADGPAGYWPLYFDDSYDFSIALFALWSTGRTPVLLPDASAHTLERLTFTPGGYLGDVPDALGWQPAEAPPWPGDDTAWSNHCHTALFTSGSTGDAMTVEKTPEQLISEVETYVALWGGALSETVFFATVTHQHIYGLLFKVLLPMALGRPFIAEMMTNPRSLLHHAAQYEQVVWVASPAQLKRTNDAIVADLTTANVGTIFSSGGLLEAEPARQVATLFSAPALEIYGSTETGGIGWRQQTLGAEAHPWTALPAVDTRLNSEGLLEVRSSYTQHEWLTTGDRGALHGAQFELLGRADRIVKLEEKRISLTATERELEALPWVALARLVVLPGNRAQLAAVIVLDEDGHNVLASDGRNPLVQRLRERLLARLEHHAVPRRFRFVHELPTTTQGKVRAVDLAALFEHGERNVLPLVTAVGQPQQDGDTTRIAIDLRVPADLDYFAGHFEGFAVVPGVVLLMWVRHYARLHFGVSGDITRLTQMKFKALVRPGQPLQMTLQHDVDRGRLKYRLAHDGKEFSSGTLHDAVA